MPKKGKTKNGGAPAGGKKQEEDLDAILAELSLLDGLGKALIPCTEEPCERPSPRVHGTLTHVGGGDAMHFLFFGGESYDGKKSHTYSELYRMLIDAPKEKEAREGVKEPHTVRWSAVRCEGGPKARSSHVAVEHQGSVYMFGGEFTSPSLAKFSHYGDTWRFEVRGEGNAGVWEDLSPLCTGTSPSPRSGHRATIAGGRMIIFGGFFDNGKEVRYYNDLHVLHLEERRWEHLGGGRGTSFNSGSPWPSARSGCGLVAQGKDTLLLLGGFTREGAAAASGEEEAGGSATWDFWRCDLTREAKGKGGTKAVWKEVGGLESSEGAPQDRAGFGMVVAGEEGRQQLLVFGGVHDEVEEEHMESVFYPDLFAYSPATSTWALAPSRGAWPNSRMNPHMAAVGSSICIFGGKVDGGDREATLDDIWLGNWAPPAKGAPPGVRSDRRFTFLKVQDVSAAANVWFGSDDEEDEEDEEEGEEYDEDQEEDDEEEQSTTAHQGHTHGGQACSGHGHAHGHAHAHSHGAPDKVSEVPAEAPPTAEERAEWVKWDAEEPCREEGGGEDAIGHGGAEVVLDDASLLGFERQGHACVRSLIRGEALVALQKAVDEEWDARLLSVFQQKIRVLGLDAKDAAFAASADSLTSVDDARASLVGWCAAKGIEVPFLQAFNLHNGGSAASQAIRRVACCPRLGQAAAKLLGVDSARLYQSSAFYKRPGHGETSWHMDLHTAPLDTNSMLTIWIALSFVETLEDSPLVFASGSHRDFALPYWHSTRGMIEHSQRSYPCASHAPLRPGDATAHHGWTLHSAPPNFSGRTRRAFALSYVADDAPILPEAPAGEPFPPGLRQSPHAEDLESYAAWLPGLRRKHLFSEGKAGGAVSGGKGAKSQKARLVARHPAIPLVWRGAKAPVDGALPPLYISEVA